jgi:hypothetical protein
VDRNSSCQETRKVETNSSCAEVLEHTFSVNSLQECYNDVIELYSDSINRNVEVEINHLQRSDTILIKLNEIELKRKDAKYKEIQIEKNMCSPASNMRSRLR